MRVAATCGQRVGTSSKVRGNCCQRELPIGQRTSGKEEGVLRADGNTYWEQTRADGLCGGNRWMCVVGRRALKGIHVEMQLSVGANRLTPLASERFHVANKGLQGLCLQPG
jgi:hypothetical protein